MSNPPPAFPENNENGGQCPGQRREWQVGQGGWIVFGCLVLALCISAAVVYMMPKKFEVRTILEVKSPGYTSDPVEVLTSDALLERVILDADLTSEFGLRDGPELRSMIRGMISVNAVSGTSLVELVVEDTIKYRATIIAEGIVRAYQSMLREEVIKEGQRFLDGLDRQIKAQEEKLGEARVRMEKALEDFRSERKATEDAGGKGPQPGR